MLQLLVIVYSSLRISDTRVPQELLQARGGPGLVPSRMSVEELQLIFTIFYIPAQGAWLRPLALPISTLGFQQNNISPLLGFLLTCLAAVLNTCFVP
jgi:hypothetical protein